MRHSDLTFGRVNFSGRRVGMRFGNGTSVAGDTTAPAISSVTASAGTYYFVGRTLTLTVTFDEAVTVTGTPRIALTIGSNTRYATYASGSGTTALVFSYTFVVGDTSAGSGYTATSPIDLNSGAINDAAGNNATLTFSAPSMSAKRAIMRGVTFASDFELTAAPDVPNKIDGTTISADVGVQGSTINSDTNDPTWIAGTGIRFDGNDFCSSMPYAGGLSNYVDTTAVFSFHTRGKYYTSFVPWNSADGSYSTGSWFLMLGNYVYFVNLTNVVSGSGSGGYRLNLGADYGDGTIRTYSLIGSGAGAGKIEFFIDGVSQGTFTGGICTANPTASDVRVGYAPGSGYYTGANSVQRALVISNVAHSANEVADMHAYLSQLPNAA